MLSTVKRTDVGFKATSGNIDPGDLDCFGTSRFGIRKMAQKRKLSNSVIPIGFVARTLSFGQPRTI